MPITLRGYKSKKSQLLGRKINSSSKSRIRSEIDYLNLEDLESHKANELGVVLRNKLGGSNKRKQELLNSVDVEIIKSFKGKKNGLYELLNTSKFSAQERTVLIAYASTRVSRVLDKVVRNKFGRQKRMSNSVSLSNQQVNELAFLLGGIKGLDSSVLKRLIESRGSKATNPRTDQHFQLSSISFLNKHVFSKKPIIPLDSFVSIFLRKLESSKDFSDFYESLSNKNLSQNERFFRLLGMTGANPKKPILFSKTIKPATIVHELVHDILSVSGKKSLFWCEPFVTMISNIASEKSGLDLKYLDDGFRKKFDSSLHYAIGSFPWRNINQRDIRLLSDKIENQIKRNPKLKKLGYSEFNINLAPIVAPIFLGLLLRKLPSYSIKDKRLVKQIAQKGIQDCGNKQELLEIKKQLQLIVKNTN